MCLMFTTKNLSKPETFGLITFSKTFFQDYLKKYFTQMQFF